MSMLKLCLATAYTQDFAEVGNLCTATLKLYAKKYGYTLKVNPDLVMPERPASWYRLKYIPELFDQGFDFVFWVDADALFLRYDLDIGEVIEPGKDLYIARIPTPEGTRLEGSSSNEPVPNAGVMLLRNCEWTRSFLEQVWSREEYLDHIWWENAAILDLFGYFSLLGKDKDQPNKALLDHVKFIDLAWNSMPHIYSCSARHPIVHHYAGMPRHRRIRKMTRDYLSSSSALAEELLEEHEEFARPLAGVEQTMMADQGEMIIDAGRSMLSYAMIRAPRRVRPMLGVLWTWGHKCRELIKT